MFEARVVLTTEVPDVDEGELLKVLLRLFPSDCFSIFSINNGYVVVWKLMDSRPAWPAWQLGLQCHEAHVYTPDEYRCVYASYEAQRDCFTHVRCGDNHVEYKLATTAMAAV